VTRDTETTGRCAPNPVLEKPRVVQRSPLGLARRQLRITTHVTGGTRLSKDDRPTWILLDVTDETEVAVGRGSLRKTRYGSYQATAPFTRDDRTYVVVVQPNPPAAAGDTPPPPPRSDPVSPHTNRGARRFLGTLVVVLVLALVAGALLTWGRRPVGRHDLSAVLISLALGAAWVGLLAAAGQLRRAISVGADGRVSTSKLAVLVWTSAIGFVLTYFVVLGWKGTPGCGPDGAAACSLSVLLSSDGSQPLATEYLLLLGGPFLSLVAARGIVAAQTESGDRQKTDEQGGAKLSQAVTGDDGEVSLQDSQYLLFNLIAFVYFAVAFMLHPLAGLPPMPLGLVALTGLGALSYVGNKVVSTNRLTLTSVTPSEPVNGEEIVLRGQNFLPDGAREVTVEIGGRLAEPVRASNSELRVVVPPQTFPAADLVTVRVTTIAGHTADTRVRGRACHPLVVVPRRTSEGEELALSTDRAVLTDSAGNFTVLIDGRTAHVTKRTSTSVSAVVPPRVTPGTDKVVDVVRGGLVVASGRVDIDPPQPASGKPHTRRWPAR